MSQENLAVVRGLLAHGATRFALLLSLLAFGAIGAVACDDDDETALTETEVITSNFGQDPPGRVVVAGGPKACGDYRKGPRAIRVRIEVFQGVVRCREARRVLKNHYTRPRSTPPWSCVDYGVEMVQCTQPGGGAFRGIIGCRVARPTEVRASCPGFELPTPGAELYPVPARKSCGHFRMAPPGDDPLILVEVVIGKVPCRAARRVLKTQYRNGSQDDATQAALPWKCARAEGLIVCDKYSGQDAAGSTDHKAIRARFPRQ